MSQVDRDAYWNQRTVVEDEKAEDTGAFWLFVGCGIAGILLIIGLIIALCRMKRRNDQIVAKVERMSKEQLEERKYINEDEKNDDFYAS